MTNHARSLFLRVPLLGAEVDIFTRDDLFAVLKDRIGRKAKTIVGNHNLHSLYLFARSRALRAYYKKVELIEIDSMPMILWAKLMGQKVTRAHRITYLDYRSDFWALAQEMAWKIYHVGGHPDTVEPARTHLLGQYPNLKLRLRSGYFDTKGPENTAILQDISDFAPDILFVGMGMPRQELWIDDNYDALPDCVILPVGAAFDYEAGAQYEPPRWTGQWGIEWLARLLHDPKRLATRYLFEPWFLIPAAFGDIWRRLTERSKS